MKKIELTPGEQEMMKAIWELTEEGVVATTSTVRKKYRNDYNEYILPQTVNIRAEALKDKGFIQIEKQENGRGIYIPCVDKNEYIKKQTNHWIEFWNQSAASYAMMALKGSEGEISKEELEEFRRFLNDID